MIMAVVDALPTYLSELVGGGYVDCECMVCHLPLDQEHGPIEWKLTWSFHGPYPSPGTATMLLCGICYDDWVSHPNELGGSPTSSHRI